MARGLFRDAHGWVEVNFCGTQAPMPREQYVVGGYQPPCAMLPAISPPSPERINDFEYWRGRAEEARTTAEQMIDQVAVATMLKIAEQFDELALVAEQHRLTKVRSRTPLPEIRRSPRKRC
jgi:hypothetical protein